VLTIRSFVCKRIDDWKHIPKEDFNALVEKINAFEKECDNITTDSTRAQIARRNMAMKACESQLRHFIRFYLRNPIVTESDLVAMHIPPIDRIRTPHFEVRETVDLFIHIRGTSNIILDFRQSGTLRKARPKNCNGAVIIWTLSDTEPLSNEAYSFHKIATRTPCTIKFNSIDRGKKAWFRIAWQNKRGIVGAFCRAQNTIVP